MGRMGGMDACGGGQQLRGHACIRAITQDCTRSVYGLRPEFGRLSEIRTIPGHGYRRSHPGYAICWEHASDLVAAQQDDRPAPCDATVDTLDRRRAHALVCTCASRVYLTDRAAAARTRCSERVSGPECPSAMYAGTHPGRRVRAIGSRHTSRLPDLRGAPALGGGAAHRLIAPDGRKTAPLDRHNRCTRSCVQEAPCTARHESPAIRSIP